MVNMIRRPNSPLWSPRVLRASDMADATVLGYLPVEGLTDVAEAGAQTVIQLGADEIIDETPEDK